MTENRCRCDRPTRNDAYVCDHCADELGKALGDVAWLAEELEVTIGRESAQQYTGGSRSAEKPLPLNWGASEARTHLKALLVSWALFCAAEGVRSTDTRPGMPADDLVALSRWLLWRVDGLMLHDIGPDAVDEITSAVAHCHRAVDIPVEKQYMGACDACETPLWARARAQVVVCKRCAAEFPTEGRRSALEDQAMDKLMDRLFTASESALILCAHGFAPDTDEVRLADRIRKWAKPRQISTTTTLPPRLATRGHVKRADKRTRPAYKLGDIRDLLEAGNTRKAS